MSRKIRSVVAVLVLAVLTASAAQALSFEAERRPVRVAARESVAASFWEWLASRLPRREAPAAQPARPAGQEKEGPQLDPHGNS
jgi:hypothetical protein